MPARRAYPDTPLVGVSALIHRRNEVLLTLRNRAPNRGLWALPGGLVQVGETLRAALAREVKEELGLPIIVESFLDVADEILFDGRGRVEFHFVVASYVARPRGYRIRLNAESKAYIWCPAGKVAQMSATSGTKSAARMFLKVARSSAKRTR